MIKILLVNVITFLRVPLAISSVWYMVHQQWTLAWLLFLSCVMTDVIDGRLARALNVTTKFGVAADFWSDVSIYWVFMLGVYTYSQYYSEWWQENMFPLRVIGILLTGFVVFISWVTVTENGKQFWRWYKPKGSFWVGVTSIALTGLWISLNVGLVALVTTISYGIVALYLNREKMKQFI